MRDPSQATTLCSFCPKLCRYSCPVAEADQNEATTPWGKMSTMRLVEEKKLPMNRDTMALAYKCLNCGASEGACELDNPVAPTLDTWRVKAFRAGLAPDPVYAYCRKFQRENNPFGKNLARELTRRFPGPMRHRKPIIYFPGCTEIATSPETIERTLRLLEQVRGGSVGLYAEAIQCCGYPLFAAGDWDNFMELAEVNSNALREYSLVLSGSPACLYTMETLYRSAGFPTQTRFLHVSEYLASHAGNDNLPIKQRRTTERVAYHDPCYLGRYRGVYDAPRRLIEAATGRPPLEFFRNREQSACCGAGGILPVSSPGTANKVTESRVEEFRRLGASLLVSACPTCVRRFRKFGVRAVDLISFLESGSAGC